MKSARYKIYWWNERDFHKSYGNHKPNGLKRTLLLRKQRRGTRKNVGKAQCMGSYRRPKISDDPRLTTA